MVYCIFNYFIGITKYLMAYELFYEGKVKNRWWIFVGAGVVAVNVVFRVDIPLFLMAYFGTLFFSMLCMDEKILSRFTKIAVLLFGITCAEMVLENPLKLYDLYHAEYEFDSNMESFFGSVLAWIGVFILYMMKKKSEISILDLLFRFINKSMPILISATAIGFFLTLVALGDAAERLDLRKYYLWEIFLKGGAGAGVGILGAFAIYAKRINNQLEESLEQEKRFYDIQMEYYQKMLDKEEDTRRYRHDISNHLICLDTLLQEENMAEAKEYVVQMQNSLIHIQNKIYHTGNAILDAITNFHLSRLSERIEVKIVGNVEDNIDIQSAHLCTVYGNLLQNAVEEVMQAKDKGFIHIQFRNGRDYFSIEIENSLFRKVEFDNQKERLRTLKKDKKNHGFGLRNAEEVMTKLGGKLSIEDRKNSFFVSAVFVKK